MPNRNAAQANLDRASIGAPITRAGVSLFPVYLQERISSKILTGPEAGLVFEELESESVPELRVSNPNRCPGLVVAGEMIEGGLQDRSLNVTVLVPAEATVAVPVSCVEADRWGRRRGFRHGRDYAPSRVRHIQQSSVSANVHAHESRVSSQAEVWRSVDEELAAQGVTTDTRTVAAAREAIHRDASRRRGLEELRRLGPLPGQCGVIMAHGRTATAADVFGSADLLRVHWEALVGSYLLERPAKGARASAGSALRLLGRFARSPSTQSPGVGLGTEVHVSAAKVSGQALVHDGTLVHASIFDARGTDTSRFAGWP